MKILFRRAPNSYLPELRAYSKYLSNKKDVSLFELETKNEEKNANYDIIWCFPGFYPSRNDIFTVHEYNSLSTGRAPRLRNTIKRVINAKPDYRVFLNERVRRGFQFADQVPFSLRDMGVDDLFFEEPAQDTSADKEFHLVYMGSVTRSRGVDRFLKSVVDIGSRLKLLIIGEPEKEIYERFGSNPDIKFTGRMTQDEIPKLATKAIAGVNWMPDIYPFNIQTSTKLLEYCALGIGVVTSRYRWAEEFSVDRGGRFLWADTGFGNVSPKTLENFDFSIPDVSDLNWQTVIRTSGLFENIFRLAGAPLDSTVRFSD